MGLSAFKKIVEVIVYPKNRRVQGGGFKILVPLVGNADFTAII